jgi:thiosulfate/3-mercaptopyruvate sulfurtransferase
MRIFKPVVAVMGVVVLALMPASPAAAKNNFEKEVEIETGAVKLFREVQRGGYAVVTTAELKQWIDSGKDMVIVATMPYNDS